MITKSQLRQRARRRKPHWSDRADYLRWWRARSALGLSTIMEISQDERLRRRREYLRKKKAEERARE